MPITNTIPPDVHAFGRRMILLDLFCGAGGAAKGYANAGFEIVGVDINPQPNYPYTFIQMDALEFLREYADGYDAIHASCPCQAYGSMSHRLARDYPRLIAPTRALLRETGLPWIMENVPTTALQPPKITLCGTMFPPLRVIRHREFETNWPLEAPPHNLDHPVVFSYRKNRPGRYGNQSEMFVQVTGGGNATVRNKRAAMGIDWMAGKELNEAIPPAYTEYIGRRLLECLSSRSA